MLLILLFTASCLLLLWVKQASKQVTVVVIDEVMLQIVRTLFDHVFIARSSPATLIQKFSKFTFCFHTPASTDNIHTDTLCKYIHKYFVLLWFGFQCDYFCFLSLLFNKKCTKQKKNRPLTILHMFFSFAGTDERSLLVSV